MWLSVNIEFIPKISKNSPRNLEMEMDATRGQAPKKLLEEWTKDIYIYQL